MTFLQTVGQTWDEHVSAIVASAKMKRIDSTWKAVALILGLISTVFMAGFGASAALSRYASVPADLESVRATTDSISAEMESIRVELQSEIRTEIRPELRRLGQDICVIRASVVGDRDPVTCFREGWHDH